jgi:hypothetical protein
MCLYRVRHPAGFLPDAGFLFSEQRQYWIKSRLIRFGDFLHKEGIVHISVNCLIDYLVNYVRALQTHNGAKGTSNAVIVYRSATNSALVSAVIFIVAILFNLFHNVLLYLLFSQCSAIDWV